MRLSAPIYQLKRRAKHLARDENIPLHQAQDRVAAAEGFAGWSLLATRIGAGTETNALLPELEFGDVLLIAARPGQGKTRLGLRLLLDAARAGRRSVLFTLEYAEREAAQKIRALANPLPEVLPEIVTSDEISADYIIRYLIGAPKSTLAVIDYMQILDQQRTKPALSDQMRDLNTFARRTGVTLAIISQVDRSYNPETATAPGFADLRLPNPIPPDIFTKACFLHEGEVRLEKLV